MHVYFQKHIENFYDKHYTKYRPNKHTSGYR